MEHGPEAPIFQQLVNNPVPAPVSWKLLNAHERVRGGNGGVGTPAPQDIVGCRPDAVVGDIIAGHVVASPGEVEVPRQLRPLSRAIAIAIEVVVLAHVVVILCQYGGGQIIELAGQVDIVENEILQSGTTGVHARQKGCEIRIVLVHAVFLLNTTCAAGPSVEHLVERPVVVDPLLAAQQTLVDLLSVCGNAEEGTVLLHPGQKTHRTRRAREVVEIVAERLTHVRLVRPCCIQIEFLGAHRIRIGVETEMVIGIKVELVALLRETGR